MTSSSSFELRLLTNSEVVATVAADTNEPRAVGVVDVPVEASSLVEAVVLRRGGWARHRARVYAGEECVAVLSPGTEEARVPLRPFTEEYGATSVICEDRGPGRARLELQLEVRAEAVVEELYERLFEELEALHVGLAQDVLGRTMHRHGAARRGASALRPQQEVDRLERLAQRMEAALTVIGNQPSHAMERRIRVGRYRAGDRIRAATAGQILAAPGTVVQGGRIRALGRVPSLRTRLSSDIAEHRHIRAGLARLARRARGVGRHCRRAAEALEPERVRWGASRARSAVSVFDRVHQPRILALEALAERAEALGQRIRRMTAEHEFVAHAGLPRSRLQPTPIFRNRTGYREIYAALREVESLSGALVSGEDLRVAYRKLSTLYEYWCFVKTVTLVSAHEATSSTEARPDFKLIDDVYRPELEPRQEFGFSLRDGGTVGVVYEPDIAGFRTADASLEPWRATLGRATLRPDVWVQVQRPGERPRVLVLDAKSKRRWEMKMLVAVTDYRTRIIDPADGYQPVFQVWMLHRDTRRRAYCNVPGYLSGRRGDQSSRLLGAAPCLPDRTSDMKRILDRFLA
jgi:hypothetical protein